MRLLGRPTSINVRKVMWAAREIGLDFDHETAWGTPARSTRADLFMQLNPHGLVPVWVDANGPLWESNTICRYLASRYERTDLLPADPYARALVERWMDWVSSDLNHAWTYAFMARVRRHPEYLGEAEVAKSTARWNALMLVLDGHLSNHGPYVAGPGFTLADVPVGLAIHRWRSTPQQRPEAPAICRYFDRLMTRPAFASLATADNP